MPFNAQIDLCALQLPERLVLTRQTTPQPIKTDSANGLQALQPTRRVAEPARSRLRIVLLLAGLALAAVALVVLRWQLLPPGPVTRDIGGPATAVSHFYPRESGADRLFRWSKHASALSLPALANRQVVSFTLNAARPDPSAVVPVRLQIGFETVARFEVRSGWNTYTATVTPGLMPDLRLVLESETFYPPAGDRRRLGVAVAEVETMAPPGRAGLLWPPTLWLGIAVAAPFLAFLLSFAHGSLRGRLTATALPVLLPAAVSAAVPSDVALPAAAWLSGVVLLVALARLTYCAAVEGRHPFRLLSRLAGTRWEVPSVGAASLLWALIFTWPLALRFGTAMPGWPADNFAFLYKFWWFRTAILERRVWPFFDANSYAPFGFNLGQGEPTLLNTIPGLPIGALFGDVAAYNTMALASFAISGIGAYLLVRELTDSRTGALFAASIFAFCPYRMAQFAGHIQLLGTGWIALAFYFTELLLKERRVRDGVFLAVSVAFTALSAWYYAYMVGLAVALYGVVRLVQQRYMVPVRSLVWPVLAAGVTVLLLVGPVAIPSLRLWRSGALTHSAKAADEHSAAPLDYLIPNQLQPVWGEPFMRAHSEQNVIESHLYLGLLPLALVAFGSIAWRRRRLLPHLSKVWPVWLGLLGVTLVLSLGLTLHDLRGQVQVALAGGTAAVPLPGAILYDWLPLYSSMRAYARFGVLAALAVAVLAGMAWASYSAIQRPARRRYLPFVAATALLLLMADFWTAPYSWGSSRVESTPVTRFLADAPPGTVMQMPLVSSKHGPALYRAALFGKPISYGYDTFEPPQFRAAYDALQSFPDDWSLDVLNGWGVRYIVVSGNAYGADWPGTLAFLRSLPRLRHLGTFQEPRLWDVDPGVLDARPDLAEYALPDTLAVFELLR